MKAIKWTAIVLGYVLLVALVVVMIAEALVNFATSALGADFDNITEISLRNNRRMLPSVPALGYSVWRTGPLDVAKVFGRSPGCTDASPELINQVTKAAVYAGLDPALAAATVAVESGCNPYAVSNRSAIGLMQIVPKVWKNDFDFRGSINLFNEQDNLNVGTKIMAKYVADFGLQAGVRHYNGMGTTCDTCDGAYVNKILSLAKR